MRRMNLPAKTYFLIFLVLTSVTGVAQRFRAEIITGFNKSQVDGDEAFGFKKYGLNTGAGVVLPLHKNWSVSFETLFSQEGSRRKKQFNDSLDGSYKLRLNYARVPFLVQYTDKDFISAGVGMSWGRLVFVDEYKNGYKVDSVSLLEGPFRTNDFQILADVRLRIYKNLKLNARYSYSLNKMATRTVIDSMSGKPNERDFYNNLWSFRLIYMINEAPPDKQKRKNTLQE